MTCNFNCFIVFLNVTGGHVRCKSVSYLIFKRRKASVTSVTLGVASAHGPASVVNDVIMRIAGLVAAGAGGRYSDWRQARVASAVGASGGLEQRYSISETVQDREVVTTDH